MATIKGTHLYDKTDHPEAGAYNASLTDYVWADDWNDLALTVNNMWSGVFTNGLDVTGDIELAGNIEMGNDASITYFHDAVVGYALQWSSDGTAGGQLYNIGIHWTTTGNRLSLRGYTEVGLNVQTTNLLWGDSTTLNSLIQRSVIA